MSPKWFDKMEKRYKYVPEYRRNDAIDWLDDYYEHDSEDCEETEELLTSAVSVIQNLLKEVNNNNQERFKKDEPRYIVFVPHTLDCYYYRYENGLTMTKNRNLNLAYGDTITNFTDIGPQNNLNDCLFTPAEIDYWGLHDCNKMQIIW